MHRALSNVAAPAYLILCILLGGASLAGQVGNAFIQAVGVVLIVLSLWNRRGGVIGKEARLLLWVAVAWTLLMILMLVPLPPSLWRALPGRDFYAAGLDLLGQGYTWQPLSLDYNATVYSALSIIPPAAMFLLVVRMPEEARRRLPWFIIAITIASVILGTFQLLGGPDSSLRFYQVTSFTLPVGFFANANHLATLALSALPFAGYLAARAAGPRSSRTQRSSAMLIAVGIALFLCVGIGVIGSLAGYALFPVSAFASALIYRRATGGVVNRRWLGGIAAVFLLFGGVSLLGPLNHEALSKKEASSSSRRIIAQRTLTAVEDYTPIGTGLGTFQNIYRLYDDPGRTDREFVNHAHNDYLEVVLELGLPGIFLVLVFLLWWIRRTLAVWSGNFRGADLARAGSVPIGIVLLHSFVDYPIRTAAIAAIVGVCCALIIPYRSSAAPVTGETEDPSDGLRHIEAD